MEIDHISRFGESDPPQWQKVEVKVERTLDSIRPYLDFPGGIQPTV
jgi:hypothetical protein